MGEQPQVVVFVPFPRPAPNVRTMGSSAEYSTTDAATRPPPTWNDDLDRRLWSCASLYPHNSVQCTPLWLIINYTIIT